MKSALTVFLILWTGVSPRLLFAETHPELTLLEALPIEGPAHLQPSGLVFREGELYAVCDKHPHTIFQVLREADSARFRPALEFLPPEGTPPDFNLDLEGICVDPSGRFHLVSETSFRALIVDGSGQARWTTPDLKPVGLKAGLFATRGGDLEGIVLLENGEYLLASERQPRGLIRVRADDESASIEAWQMEDPDRMVPKGRTLDFSDLCQWRGRLFVLERNLHLVTELLPDGDRFQIGESWSYEKTVNAPEWRYADRTYGLAEGLAINDREILVLIDNNEGARAGDPDDHRPVLFVFRNPIE
ncbi:MAG: hypothetical protein R3F07_03435 [Opitutaceae bacterium]